MRVAALVALVLVGACSVQPPHHVGLDADGDDAPPFDGAIDASLIDASLIDAAGDAITVVVGQHTTGARHTCALVGTAPRCWGEGDFGRLGYGNSNDIGDNETPISTGTVNVGADVAAIVGGGSHTCALTTTGAVRCWGVGASGQLGYANTNHIGDNETPASAGNVNVGGTVTQLTAGNAFTCALLTGGAVRCWGLGVYGELGYGNETTIGDNETPASAGDVSVGGTVTQIAAGSSHACALLSTGNVRCWGFAGMGQLGYGNINRIGDNELPSSAGDVDVGGTVVQIAAGGSHTCALLEGGAIRCWGFNEAGQLGLGNTTTIGDDEDPSSVPTVDLGGTAVYVAAGASHTCALLRDGGVRCWGQGDFGALGYVDELDVGDNEDPYSAGDVDVGGVAVGLTLGNQHTCALLDDGAVRCWGYGSAGRLGYGDILNIGDNETPSSKGDVPFR